MYKVTGSSVVQLHGEDKTEVTIGGLEGKNILLLQGPVGGFMARLGIFLAEQGCNVRKIDFNAGDSFFSRGLDVLRFSGGLAEWKVFFNDYLESNPVDLIVAFGSERPVHKAAREVADAFRLPLCCLEEGYIRPGYITAEMGGNNDNSPLAGRLPDADWKIPVNVSDAKDFKSFSRFSVKSATYYCVRSFFTFGRSKELYHRRFSPPLECFHWVRNFYRRFTGEVRNYRVIEKLLEHHDKRFYLVPLQVAADANLQRAAMGWNSRRVIAESIASFSKAAPSNTRLVFKVHPLERGHCDYVPYIEEMAAEYGVADRVAVIDIGSMGLLARHCAGMITINSTSGLSAIFHGVPLLLIGKALYANSELAMCANGEPDFDCFWSNGFVAPAALRRRYIEWLRESCLVHGDFYSEEGIEIACTGLATKFTGLFTVAQDSAVDSAAS